MVDKIDVAQNKAIKSVEDRLDEVEASLKDLERLKALEPLLNHMTQILRYFGVHQ